MRFSRFFARLRSRVGTSVFGSSVSDAMPSWGQRVFRGLLRVALLVAVAGPVCAEPENVDLGYMGLGTAQDVCRTANTGAWQSGVALAQPGRWWNPKRYGTGWDLVYSDDRKQLKVFLYTYNASGHPVWLASKMIRIDEATGDFWRADLYEYTKHATTGEIDTGTDVGDVYFRFFRDDPSRIAMRWHWRDIPSAQLPAGKNYFEECLNDLTRLNPTYYTGTSAALETKQLFSASLTPGLNQTFSGYWSDINNVEAIPGVVMTIMQTSLGTEEGKLGEAAVWLTFNETPEVINGVSKKRPIFMQAQRAQLRPSLPFETDAFDLYFHYAIGYPDGFPTVDCPGPNNCVSNIPIGTYERTFHSASNYRTASVRYTLDGADANGLITVPNTGGRPPVKLLGQFSPGGTAMATVHRTTRLQDISVNRYVCGLPATVPPNPPPTCDIFVSWSGNNIGKPWKRDLGALRYDAAPFSVVDVGIERVPMRAGDRFQMELWSGVPGAPGAVMLDKAPEIRGVLLDSANPGAITVPDADPISNQEDLGPHVATVGAVVGSADVSGGAASYTVPIAVPPGRNGMQPSVSLSYSSRGGNGVAGLGWSLGAGSSIHRCPRTRAQDGYPRGVRLDAEDRLCLDGQRLMSAPDGGTYGTPNARYRTEIESFAQVEQSGSLALGDVCFTVQQKDGRKLTYGCTPPNQQACAGGVPPRVRPSEKNVELSWLLSRVEDRSGNTMEFCYESGADTSEVLLKKIAYTGSTLAGAAAPVATPTRSVVFIYAARPTDWRGNDRSSSWIAGGGLQQSRRLTEVRTYSPDSVLPLRMYELDYKDTAVSDLQYSYTSGRSLLRRITECAYDSTGVRSCLLPTEFSWSDGNWMFENRRFVVSPPGAQQPAPTTPLPSGDEEHYVPEYRRNRIEATGDLDGDGAREWWVAKTWYDGMWRTQVQLAKVNADRVTQGVATIIGLPPFARTADLDGDGIAELLSGTTIYKWKRGRGSPMCDGGAATCTATAGGHFTLVATNLPAGSHDSIEGIADFNGDGAPDILMRGPLLDPCPVSSIAPEGVDGELPTGCAPLYVDLNTRPGAITTSTTNFAFTRTAMLGTLSANGGLAESVQHLTDFNGDGLTDVVIARASGVTRVLRTTLSGSMLGSTELSPSDAGFTGDTSNLRWLDVNGDGLDDALSVSLPASVGACDREGQCHGFWKLQLNDGGKLRPAATLDGSTTAGLRFDAVRGGNTPQLRYFGKLLSSDIDADGRGDLLYPARFAARLCFGAYLPHNRFLAARPAKDCPVQQGHGATCEADVCAAPPPEDGNTWDEHPGSAKLGAADTFKSGLGAFDPSVYRFNAIRFVQTGANAFRLQIDETPVIAATSVLGNQAGRIDDYFGDGLADVVSDVTCPLRPNALFPLNTCSLAAGGMAGPGLADGSSFVDSSQTIRMSDLVTSSNINLLINENQGDGARSGVSPMFPDLMVVAVNGLKERAQWDYYPLSSSAGRSGSDFPLYRIDGDYVDARHFLFQSSMPVVSQMARSNAATGSNGLPAFGTRSVRYAYGGAMYHSEGRGFQGFRTIASETLGQPDRTVRTVTTFHQKFPLTGRIESVETRVPQIAGINGRLSLESFDWRCNRANRLQICPGQSGTAMAPDQIYWPYLSKSVKETYDLAAAEAGSVPLPVSSTITLNGKSSGLASGWDPYGNLTDQQVTTRDGTGVANSERYYLASHVTTTVNTFDTSTAQVLDWWLDKQTESRVQTTVSYHGRAAPDGISLSPKEILTQFEWNPDRTPSASTVTDPLSGTSVRTGYTYPTPSLGLPDSTTVSGTGIAPVRQTRVGYGPDGYFPISTTAVISAATPSLNHTATTQVRASDGQPVTTTDANGIQARHQYDAFGRRVHSRTYSAGGVALGPASELSIKPCGTAYPCSAADESTAAYYQSTVADGAPSQRAWFDLLGREVKRAKRGFDGRWVNVSTRYDASGTASQTSAPYFTGETPLYTQLTYDRLSRTKSKHAPVAELNPAQGDVVTTYTYDGLETRIEVRPANAAACTSSPNLCLTMSRQHNALGQLMRTTDAHSGRTDYWFDPMGGAAALRDANGKVTLASYTRAGSGRRSCNAMRWAACYSSSASRRCRSWRAVR
jgi:YD repeat-containing protein